MLHMLMDTDLDANQQDYVRTAQDSGKALVSLINEVLDQAKIESGKIELEEMQFDLRAIMDDVLALFSGKAHEKGIEVIYVFRNVLLGFLWAILLVSDPSLVLFHCLLSKF
jgi:histidine kinase 2/3/4 (cytokinin receptor)